MKATLPIIIVGATLTLTGCSSLTSERNLSSMRDHLVAEGKPPAYADGYMDGCNSGRALAGLKGSRYRKDSVRAENDALYARGWQDGQITCRNEAIIEKQQQAMVAGTDPSCSNETLRRRQEEAEMQAIWEELKK